MIQSPPELRTCACGCTRAMPANPRAQYATRNCKQVARQRRRAVEGRSGRTCAHCDGPVPTTRRRDALTCSDACGVARDAAQQAAARVAARGAVARYCLGCDELIPATRRAYARYCSDDCRTERRGEYDT